MAAFREAFDRVPTTPSTSRREPVRLTRGSRRGVHGGFQSRFFWARGCGRSGPAGQCATGVVVQAGPCGSAPHPGGMTDEPSSMTGVRVTLVIAEIVGVSHGS